MAGELVLERWQIGKQTVEATAVAATRVVYVRPGSGLTRERESRPWNFMTGTPDNVRAHTQGPVEAGGSVEMPASADELIEWLLCTVKGGVTPSTPAGATNQRLWTFVPSTTLDVMTIERNNGAITQRGVGYRGAQMTIEGSVSAENVVTIELFGLNREDNYGSLTGALAERVPSFFEGWQTNFYIDTFGTAPGQTRITDLLLGWTITINKPLERQYTAQNSLSANNINFGAYEITAELMVRQAAAQFLTELVNADADTKRILRFEFLGPAGAIDTAVNEIQSLVATGASSGTFTLSFRGATTGTIAFNAAASAVQTALRALSTIGATGVTCTGGPLPTTPVVITFAAPNAAANVPLITADNTLLVGGTAVITQTTAGFHGGRALVVDIPGAWTSPDMDQDDALARAASFPFTYVYDSVLAAGLQILVYTNRTTAF
jgi:hypothetical protein